MDFAYSLAGTARFRVNAYYQRGSVAMAMRRVRASAATVDELGLPEVVTRLAEEMRGLVLVTGPTGSGKTTTLAAMIDHINHTRSCHVVTIEDPVEYLHTDDLADIDQREVGFDTDTFSSAMRVVLRQDPDVILVGEMRDQETVLGRPDGRRDRATWCSRLSTPSTPPRPSTGSSTSSHPTSRPRPG